jgi:linoleoyl-CoA desaturase
MIPHRFPEVIAMTSESPRLRFEQREQGAFYREVRAAAASYLAEHGGSARAPFAVRIKCVALALLAAACYGAVFVEALPQAARLAAYVGFGIAAILLAVNAGHEAAHGALLRSASTNTLVNRLTFMLVGVDGRMWTKRHLSSHHVYPNILGCDADIDASYLLRLSPHHPHRWYQRWQHIYAPIVYPLVQVHSIFVQDIVYLFRRRLANLSGLRPTPRESPSSWR